MRSRQLLDKTPTGHLTPPERTAEGIEMIAVCSKGISTDDTAVRKAISERLLGAQMRADADAPACGTALLRRHRQALMPAPRGLVALTRGDPSGIGPELALKAWAALHADADGARLFHHRRAPIISRASRGASA